MNDLLLPEKSHGRRSLVGCRPRGRKESDTTERLHYKKRKRTGKLNELSNSASTAESQKYSKESRTKETVKIRPEIDERESQYKEDEQNQC